MATARLRMDRDPLPALSSGGGKRGVGLHTGALARTSVDAVPSRDLASPDSPCPRVTSRRNTIGRAGRTELCGGRSVRVDRGREQSIGNVQNVYTVVSYLQQQSNAGNPSASGLVTVLNDAAQQFTNAYQSCSNGIDG
jgi:hypothetical protein